MQIHHSLLILPPLILLNKLTQLYLIMLKIKGEVEMSNKKISDYMIIYIISVKINTLIFELTRFSFLNLVAIRDENEISSIYLCSNIGGNNSNIKCVKGFNNHLNIHILYPHPHLNPKITFNHKSSVGCEELKQTRTPHHIQHT